MNNLDDIFLENYIKKLHEKYEKEKLLNQEAKIICEKKNKKLEPIRNFLQKFIDQGVQVHHKDKFNADIIIKDENTLKEQPFYIYDKESSETWSPGISIMFDHPAEVEIAIAYDNKQRGVDYFAVNVATPHPNANILSNNYINAEDLCKALAEFIFLNTTSLNTEYKKLLPDDEKKVVSFKKIDRPEDEKNFLLKAPNHPPKKPFGLEKHYYKGEQIVLDKDKDK